MTNLVSVSYPPVSLIPRSMVEAYPIYKLHESVAKRGQGVQKNRLSKSLITRLFDLGGEITQHNNSMLLLDLKAYHRY